MMPESLSAGLFHCHFLTRNTSSLCFVLYLKDSLKVMLTLKQIALLWRESFFPE